MDRLVSMAINILLEELKDKKQIRKIAPALRKVYLNLHANRLIFLRETDFAALGQEKPEGE